MTESRRNRSLSRKRQNLKTTDGRPSWPILLAAILGVLLIAGGIWWGVDRGAAPPTDFVPQVEGPRLAVDRTDIDLGVQPLDRYVSATFQVKNVGDTTLRIQEEPYVELVEGC